ncbi:hypothetical protein SCP_0101620 [Sparassis crispa]|uniref:Uncharacterized protein n=1 Tax=Sparassis crispa TaxID=139825 RepID=A0A401G560_9APHY|nr:hypothetical protein SCP_0101620 [Sparassis crispa]GBE77289.1 hypothetical protein SCP_0101620 [Sparassis crispa]
MSPIEIFVDHSSIRGITENLSSPEWSSIITLFNDVQSHLIQSKATRSAYLEILVDFYNLNDEAEHCFPSLRMKMYYTTSKTISLMYMSAAVFIQMVP